MAGRQELPCLPAPAPTGCRVLTGITQRCVSSHRSLAGRGGHPVVHGALPAAQCLPAGPCKPHQRGSDPDLRPSFPRRAWRVSCHPWCRACASTPSWPASCPRATPLQTTSTQVRFVAALHLVSLVFVGVSVTLLAGGCWQGLLLLLLPTCGHDRVWALSYSGAESACGNPLCTVPHWHAVAPHLLLCRTGAILLQRRVPAQRVSAPALTHS